MIYDPENQIIWMRIEATVADAGPISGLSGMVPTENGFIQINGYSLQKDYPSYEAVFRSIAASVSVNPTVAYKPRWTDNLPSFITGLDWGKAIVKGLAGGLAVVVILGIPALISAFKGNNKKPAKKYPKKNNLSIETVSVFKKGSTCADRKGLLQMNEKQRRIILVGIAVIVFMGIYPPWTFTFKGNTTYSEEPAGYGLIVSPPDKKQDSFYHGIKIDTSRLLIQWAVVGAAIGMGLLMIGREKDE